jgi:RNA polymerase sigma factor (sigma-70 family)
MNTQDHGKNGGADDRSLLLRVLSKRDAAALTILYERFQEDLRRHLFAYVLWRGDTADVIQEVFACLWQGRCAYDNESDVGSYLVGMAKNIARKHLQRERRRREACSTILAALRTGSGPGERGKDPSDPQTITQDKEMRDRMLLALTRLSRKAREALELVYIRGLRSHEAAARLRCPFPVFRNRIHYGLARLRHELGDLEDPGSELRK